MKILWSWLAQHWDPQGCSPQEACEALARGGLDASFSPAFLWAQQVQVAYIACLEPHPNANRLKVCKVHHQGVFESLEDLSNTQKMEACKTIVCGAENARQGLWTFLALPGAQLPGLKQPLSQNTMRGVVSQGMLCSAQELALSDVVNPFFLSEGLLDLALWCEKLQELPGNPEAEFLISPDRLKNALRVSGLGTSLWELLNPDFILDVEITPNRPDVLSHQGLARELCLLGLGCLRKKNAFLKPKSLAQGATFSLEVPRHCFSFPVQKISENVLEDSLESPPPPQDSKFVEASSPESIEKFPHPASPKETMVQWLGFSIDAHLPPTPCWIKRRLHALDIHLHHLLVDWSHYIAEDMGQPLHLYDGEAVQGRTLFLDHLSQEWEKWEALNEKFYTLPKGTLVIRDEKGPLAIAGILGGKRGSCQANSKFLILESAFFSPEAIQSMSNLGIHTLARYRFERGTDPEGVNPAMEMFLEGLKEILKNTSIKLENFQKVSWQGDFEKVEGIPFSLRDCQTKSGVDLDLSEVFHRLRLLGARCSKFPFLEDAPNETQQDISPEEVFWVFPPSWARPWKTFEDTVENLFRLKGYQEVPLLDLPVSTVSSSHLLQEALKPTFQKPLMPQDALAHDFSFYWILDALKWRFRRFWVAKGAYESVNLSMVSEKDNERFPLASLEKKRWSQDFFEDSKSLEIHETGGFYGKDLENFQSVRISNPLSQEQNVLRCSLVPSLLNIFQHHKNYRWPCRPFFEMGPRFYIKQDQMVQDEVLALAFPLLSKEDTSLGFSENSGSFSKKALLAGDETVRVGAAAGPWEKIFFSLRQHIQESMEDLLPGWFSFVHPLNWQGVETDRLIRGAWSAEAPSWLHSGQSATLWTSVKNQPQEAFSLGYLGTLHPSLETPVLVAEISLTALAHRLHQATFSLKGVTDLGSFWGKSYEIPQFQPIVKDLSFYLTTPRARDVASWLPLFYSRTWSVELKEVRIMDLCDVALETAEREASPVRRSLTLRFIFQPKNEILDRNDLIMLLRDLNHMAKEHGAILRGSLGV